MSESDTTSDTTSDAIPDDLQQLWKEAIDECERVECLHATILRHTAELQASLLEEDGIMVTYQGVHQDLMDVLDSIHAVIQEDSNANVGPMLLEMLDSCEFKTNAT